MLGPRQEIYRASCNGTMIRLRVNVDNAWITIDRPNAEPFYRETDQGEVAGVLAEFRAIGGCPEKFEAFVSALKS